MKRFWISLAAAAALSAPAYAADLMPAYKAAPSLPPAANWSGLYAGLNGGGGVLNGDIMDPECYTCASTTLHAGFGTFGGQIGYNWQLSSLVYGLEGDLNWASANKSTGYALDDTGLSGTATLKMDAFASLRGRLGLAVGPTLIYVTGGPAWGHFDSSVVLGNQAPKPSNIGTATDNEWRLGVAGGAGVEYMVTDHWIARGEFMFLDFLDAQQTFTKITCSYGVPCKESFGNTAALVRVGASYKW